MGCFGSNAHAQTWRASGGLGYSSFDNGLNYQVGLLRQTKSRFYNKLEIRVTPESVQDVAPENTQSNQYHFHFGWSDNHRLISLNNYFGVMYRVDQAYHPSDPGYVTKSNSAGLVSGLDVSLNTRISPYIGVEYAVFGHPNHWNRISHWDVLNSTATISAGVQIAI